MACLSSACCGLLVAVVLSTGAQADDARPVDTLLGRQVPARADAPAVATTTQARSHYVLHCAGCHGFDGAGSRIGQVPDMRRMGDFLRLPGGREFIVQVPGVLGSGLNDAQVADVTNWLFETLAAASRPVGFQPYDAAEVARAARAATGRRGGAAPAAGGRGAGGRRRAAVRPIGSAQPRVAAAG